MRQDFARSRRLTRIGESIGATYPKDELLDKGVIDEDGEFQIDRDCVQPFVDEERDVIGLEIQLDS